MDTALQSTHLVIASPENYSVSLVHSAERIRRAQVLRFEVFNFETQVIRRFWNCATWR